MGVIAGHAPTHSGSGLLQPEFGLAQPLFIRVAVQGNPAGPTSVGPFAARTETIDGCHHGGDQLALDLRQLGSPYVE